MKSISVSINGTPHQLDVDEERRLLWVLRDDLGLTGTKFGCGVSACGACTVIIDGKAVHSCVTAMKAVDGKQAWFSTDKGLAYYDGENWAVYRPALDTHKPEMLIRDAAGRVTHVETGTAPAHNYVFGVDFQGDDIWVATAKGLSHGIRIR